MTDQKKTRGALFLNEYNDSSDDIKKHYEYSLKTASAGKDRSPILKGSIDFSADDVRHLVEQAKAGGDIKMDMAAWGAEAKSGKLYLSVNISEVYKKKEPEAPTLDLKDDLSDEVPF